VVIVQVPSVRDLVSLLAAFQPGLELLGFLTPGLDLRTQRPTHHLPLHAQHSEMVQLLL
jgi:hypothetical protein